MRFVTVTADGSFTYCFGVSGGSFTKSKSCTSVYENVSSNTLNRIATRMRYVPTIAGVFNVWVRSSILYAVQDAM